MSVLPVLIVVGVAGLAVLVVIGFAAFLIWQGRKSKLSEPQLESMRTAPPIETLEALKSEGTPVQVLIEDDDDDDEKADSSFAKQVEYIVRANLKADPFLKSILIDFATDPNGGLEFNINGSKYARLEDIPEGRVKVIIKQAVEDYKQRA